MIFYGQKYSTPPTKKANFCDRGMFFSFFKWDPIVFKWDTSGNWW